MALNSSSSSNDSLLRPDVPSSSSLLPLDSRCYFSRPSSFVLTVYYITKAFLLLPLCIFITYHGLQQWWKKRSTSSAAPMSHSDSFTYHMVAMEMLGVFGYILICCGISRVDSNMLVVGFFFASLTWCGELFFHILTCVERYLAVVHPVTYLSLRRERGVRIRNITIGCVWLLSFVNTGLAMIEKVDKFLYLCILSLSLIIVSFCSLSVLCVLIRPGPGEQGAGRERVNQSKQRAFYAIVAILGVLMLRFAAGLIWSIVYATEITECMINTCLVWFNVPSSLVLLLLFVHREGKLVCGKKNIQ